jgi:hypothetical protein
MHCAPLVNEKTIWFLKKKVDPNLRVDMKNMRNKNALKAKRDKLKEKFNTNQDERFGNQMR